MPSITVITAADGACDEQRVNIETGGAGGGGRGGGIQLRGPSTRPAFTA